MTVCGDVAVEANETFNVNLSNASDSATITDPNGVGTIENDDVSFSIDDVQQLEGQSGTTSFVFTVTKTGTVAGLAGTRTIDYATSSGTATGGLTCPGVDYESTSGSLTFLAADASQTITVTVCGDVAVEANETFNVNLSNASDSATITDPTGVGTIENDDVSSQHRRRPAARGPVGHHELRLHRHQDRHGRRLAGIRYDRLRDQQRDRDRRPDLPGRRLRVRPAAA